MNNVVKSLVTAASLAGVIVVLFGIAGVEYYFQMNLMIATPINLILGAGAGIGLVLYWIRLWEGE